MKIFNTIIRIANVFSGWIGGLDICHLLNKKKEKHTNSTMRHLIHDESHKPLIFVAAILAQIDW